MPNGMRMNTPIFTEKSIDTAEQNRIDAFDYLSFTKK